MHDSASVPWQTEVDEIRTQCAVAKEEKDYLSIEGIYFIDI